MLGFVSVFHPWLFNHRGHKGRYVGARGGP